MRVVFMGNPSFAVPVLEALYESAYQVVGVYTTPDKPAGRGKRLAAPPIKEFALSRGLPVFQPASLRSRETQAELAALAPEAIVVAAYGRLLPPEVLHLPPLSCVNLHPSLLPRHRGASPVASAILEGDQKTGVSIIQVDEGIDMGPILAQEETELGSEENTGGLTARLFKMGARLLLETLPPWARGEIEPKPQDSSRATLSRRLSRGDGEMDWNLPAVTLWREVRAYYPWPGSYTSWRGRHLKILEASVAEEPHSAEPGDVIPLGRGGIGVVTSGGALLLRRLQLEGRRAMGIREFTQGYRDFVGQRLGT